MTYCPIGLICNDFKCDRAFCNFLAQPWPLPFFVNPRWMSGVNLLVTVLDYNNDFPEDEHLLEAYERSNFLVERIRDEIWLAGWWKAVDLPYRPHPDGGLVVVDFRRLDEDVRFACYLTVDSYETSDFYEREQFAPPVPINGYELIYGKAASLIVDREVMKNGFFKYVLDADFFVMGNDNQYYPRYGKVQ